VAIAPAIKTSTLVLRDQLRGTAKKQNAPRTAYTAACKSLSLLKSLEGGKAAPGIDDRTKMSSAHKAAGIQNRAVLSIFGFGMPSPIEQPRRAFDSRALPCVKA